MSCVLWYSVRFRGWGGFYYSTCHCNFSHASIGFFAGSLQFTEYSVPNCVFLLIVLDMVRADGSMEHESVVVVVHVLVWDGE